MLTSVSAQCALFITMRIFFETLDFRNTESAARLTSIFHSLGTAYFIQSRRNYESIATTLFSLCLDWAMNTWYGKKSRPSSVIHHSAGIGLCVFSICRQTYEPGHVWEPITMALVSMEITNPIVHLTIVCHDEWKAGFRYFKIPLCALTLLAWLYFRIWNLGLIEFQLWKDTPLNVYTHWYFHCVLVLCLMQIYWFKKLVYASIKK